MSNIQEDEVEASEAAAATLAGRAAPVSPLALRAGEARTFGWRLLLTPVRGAGAPVRAALDGRLLSSLLGGGGGHGGDDEGNTAQGVGDGGSGSGQSVDGGQGSVVDGGESGVGGGQGSVVDGGQGGVDGGQTVVHDGS